MKNLKLIFSAFLTSATPNLFGSVKRRKEKSTLASGFKEDAASTQADIDALKTQNPFETASAKSAMAESSRKAKQVQQRFANTMGGNANPEALIAAQQATQEAVSGTAGDIAVGSEVRKSAELAQLRGEKSQQLTKSAALEQASINERGSGWKDFFASLDGIGAIAEGVGSFM